MLRSLVGSEMCIRDSYVDAAGAQAALAISDDGTTLTYTDAAGMVQTYTPSVPDSGIQRLVTSLPDRSELLNDDPNYVDAAGAQAALAISDDGTTLTYTDAAGMVQTYTPSVPDSGIQRLVTNLPDRSELLNDDPTTEYWVRIDTQSPNTPNTCLLYTSPSPRDS